MAKILIIFYSKGGNTQKMAEFVRAGVDRAGGVDVELKNVEETSIDEMRDADGIIIGSPTYYGGMAWPLKKLLDESVAYHGRLRGKVGAAFSSSANIGGGNETTIMDIIKAMMIHGMIISGSSSGDHYGPVAIGKPDERAERQCIRLGERTAMLVNRLFGS
jgi:NAD(P)H dehydrogenase (quinone)